VFTIEEPTQSFKPFWLGFIKSQQKLVKKLAIDANRSPVLAGKISNNTNLIFGWEFRAKENKRYNEFCIFINYPDDPFDWFKEFLAKNLDLVKKIIEKQKVPLDTLKVIAPTKIIVSSIKFDTTTISTLLEEKNILQQCINCAKQYSSQLFKAAKKINDEFTWFINERTSPNKISRNW
jgi:hypothetical protein